MTSWRTAAVSLLSFSSGLPFGLVMIAVPDWMASSGVSISVVGLITLAQAPWAFKVLWSPLMDRYAPPWLGRRRGWAAVAQVALFALTLIRAGAGESPERRVGAVPRLPCPSPRPRDPGLRRLLQVLGSARAGAHPAVPRPDGLQRIRPGIRARHRWPRGDAARHLSRRLLHHAHRPRSLALALRLPADVLERGLRHSRR